MLSLLERHLEEGEQAALRDAGVLVQPDQVRSQGQDIPGFMDGEGSAHRSCLRNRCGIYRCVGKGHRQGLHKDRVFREPTVNEYALYGTCSYSQPG